MRNSERIFFYFVLNSYNWLIDYWISPSSALPRLIYFLFGRRVAAWRGIHIPSSWGLGSLYLPSSICSIYRSEELKLLLFRHLMLGTFCSAANHWTFFFSVSGSNCFKNFSHRSLSYFSPEIIPFLPWLFSVSVRILHLDSNCLIPFQQAIPFFQLVSYSRLCLHLHPHLVIGGVWRWRWFGNIGGFFPTLMEELAETAIPAPSGESPEEASSVSLVLFGG